MKESKFFNKNLGLKVIRVLVLIVVIVIIPLSISIYNDSRREKYDGRVFHISAQKCSPDKNTVYFEMYCTMWESNRGSVIKNDPQHFDTEFLPEERAKLFKKLSEFDTYILLDLAEKYIDEGWYVYPEAKVKAAKNEYYILSYYSSTNDGREKTLRKFAENPREMGYIYQIIAFEYYFHNYFWTLIVGAILLAVILGVISKRKDNKWKMTTSADLY